MEKQAVELGNVVSQSWAAQLQSLNAREQNSLVILPFTGTWLNSTLNNQLCGVGKSPNCLTQTIYVGLELDMSAVKKKVKMQYIIYYCATCLFLT